MSSMKQTTSEEVNHLLVISVLTQSLTIVKRMTEELAEQIRDGSVIAFHLGNHKKFNRETLDWEKVPVIGGIEDEV